MSYSVRQINSLFRLSERARETWHYFWICVLIDTYAESMCVYKCVFEQDLFFISGKGTLTSEFAVTEKCIFLLLLKRTQPKKQSFHFRGYAGFIQSHTFNETERSQIILPGIWWKVLWWSLYFVCKTINWYERYEFNEIRLNRKRKRFINHFNYNNWKFNNSNEFFTQDEDY